MTSKKSPLKRSFDEFMEDDDDLEDFLPDLEVIEPDYHKDIKRQNIEPKKLHNIQHIKVEKKIPKSSVKKIKSGLNSEVYNRTKNNLSQLHQSKNSLNEMFKEVFGLSQDNFYGSDSKKSINNSTFGGNNTVKAESESNIDILTNINKAISVPVQSKSVNKTAVKSREDKFSNNKEKEFSHFGSNLIVNNKENLNKSCKMITNGTNNLHKTPLHKIPTKIKSKGTSSAISSKTLNSLIYKSIGKSSSKCKNNGKLSIHDTPSFVKHEIDSSNKNSSISSSSQTSSSLCKGSGSRINIKKYFNNDCCHKPHRSQTGSVNSFDIDSTNKNSSISSSSQTSSLSLCKAGGSGIKQLFNNNYYHEPYCSETGSVNSFVNTNEIINNSNFNVQKSNNELNGLETDLNNLDQMSEGNYFNNISLKNSGTVDFIKDFIDDIFSSLPLKIFESLNCPLPHVSPLIDNVGVSQDCDVKICVNCYWPINLKFALNASPVRDKVIKNMIQMAIDAKTIKKFKNYKMTALMISKFNMDIQLKIRNRYQKYLVKSKAGVNKEEEEEEELGVAETFYSYKPSKLQVGYDHPDSVVETASLSAIEPPDVTYKLTLPSEIIDERKLSSLQLETIVYASQRFEFFLPNGERAGFLVGDGAGVGKGRTIAGLIFENYLAGRKKHLWISVSNDLKFDAIRDLNDIGAAIKVCSLSKQPYGKIKNFEEGLLFSTYSALIGKTKIRKKGLNIHTRMAQIINWCGKKFDGCIVFDECHKAKNLIACEGKTATKTGIAVLSLQKSLPKARIFYASATGASEPKNMAYMTRLGLWGSDTPFQTFVDFKRGVDKRGVGAMEMIALDMKLRGAYLARQLSFNGVSFHIEEVTMTEKLKKLYDRSCIMWKKALTYIQALCELESPGKKNRMVNGFFWGAHQRFFKYLCIAAKVDRAVKLAQESIAKGNCVVLALQMTGEASTNTALKKNKHIDDFVSSARKVIESILEMFNESQIYKMKGIAKDKVLALREALSKEVKTVAPQLPPSSLDELIHKLGGPKLVAEMTGRKGRIVEKENGEIGYVYRAEDDEMEMINMNEKRKFMNGDKTIAIISDAASTGISLQSDLREKNQKRRVHITLELPWSADKAIQQFGRTHRSNQANAPEYIILITDLGGERRFASSVAKRLESLGALTHGDRRATEVHDLSSFNVESKYGTKALSRMLDVILKGGSSIVAPPKNYAGDFYADFSETLSDVGMFAVDKSSNYELNSGSNVKKFLNRILGLPVKMQNVLFKFFVDTHDALIAEEKKFGKYDLGILDLGIGGQSCLPVNIVKWKLQHSTGHAETALYTVIVERGTSWKEAMELYNNSAYGGNFYVSRSSINSIVILALKEKPSTNYPLSSFVVYKPNSGQGRPIKGLDLEKKFLKATLDNAKRVWDEIFTHTKDKCLHRYWRNYCANSKHCEYGKRKCFYYILCGAILNVWTSLEMVQNDMKDSFRRLKIVRLQTSDGRKLVGVSIHKNVVSNLTSILDDIVREEGTATEGQTAATSKELLDDIFSKFAQNSFIDSTGDEYKSIKGTGIGKTSIKSEYNGCKRTYINNCAMADEDDVESLEPPVNANLDLKNEFKAIKEEEKEDVDCKNQIKCNKVEIISESGLIKGEKVEETKEEYDSEILEAPMSANLDLKSEFKTIKKEDVDCEDQLICNKVEIKEKKVEKLKEEYDDNKNIVKKDLDQFNNRIPTDSEVETFDLTSSECMKKEINLDQKFSVVMNVQNNGDSPVKVETRYRGCGKLELALGNTKVKLDLKSLDTFGNAEESQGKNPEGENDYNVPDVSGNKMIFKETQKNAGLDNATNNLPLQGTSVKDTEGETNSEIPNCSSTDDHQETHKDLHPPIVFYDPLADVVDCQKSDLNATEMFIDAKSDLLTIKEFLGIPGPSNSSLMSQNWKSTLREIQSDVKKIRDFFFNQMAIQESL